MKNMATISSENLQNLLRNDRHFVFRKQCFHFPKLKFPSNFQEGNLRIEFPFLIRTLRFTSSFTADISFQNINVKFPSPASTPRHFKTASCADRHLLGVLDLWNIITKNTTKNTESFNTLKRLDGTIVIIVYKECMQTAKGSLGEK